MSGTLSIVATPIGNLDEVSPRVRVALEAADLIACEDTRRTGKLLNALGIKKRMLSLHEHNERQRLSGLVARLEAGESIALVSDAGTPVLSDPGYLLVRAAAERGIVVTPIGVASAALAALVISGLPPLPAVLLGFPPPRSGKRKAFYRKWAEGDHTLVLFESPHRLIASLEDALTELGDRPAVLARELTKLHEEVVRGSIREILEVFRAVPSIKGEITLVVGSPAATERRDRES